MEIRTYKHMTHSACHRCSHILMKRLDITTLNWRRQTETKGGRIKMSIQAYPPKPHTVSPTYMTLIGTCNKNRLEKKTDLKKWVFFFGRTTFRLRWADLQGSKRKLCTRDCWCFGCSKTSLNAIWPEVLLPGG